MMELHSLEPPELEKEEQDWRLGRAAIEAFKGMKILETTRFNPDMIVMWYWCDRGLE